MQAVMRDDAKIETHEKDTEEFEKVKNMVDLLHVTRSDRPTRRADKWTNTAALVNVFLLAILLLTGYE